MSILDKIMKFFSDEENEETGSKNIAKDRLQFILVQDRIKLTPDQMEDLKGELLEVMQKYIDVEDDRVDMEISREDERMAMVANFPLENKKD